MTRRRLARIPDDRLERASGGGLGSGQLSIDQVGLVRRQLGYDPYPPQVKATPRLGQNPIWEVAWHAAFGDR
jgi:hypothetical protein